eukprot:3562504-Karenia_brevis.AAC.2
MAPRCQAAEPWAYPEVEAKMARAQQELNDTIAGCREAAARLQQGKLEAEERKDLLKAVNGIKTAAKRVHQQRCDGEG